MTDGRMLPWVSLGMSVLAMAFAGGVAWGGRDSDSTNRLDALSARMTRMDAQLEIVERIAHDNAKAIGTLIEKFAGYVETRQIIVQDSTKDRAQLNQRVTALENDRIAAARLEQRLQAIEDILRDRLPDRGAPPRGRN